MAIYWQDREWWYGGLNAFGGRSTQGGNGGPGTVYLQVRCLLLKQIKLPTKLCLKIKNDENKAV